LSADNNQQLAAPICATTMRARFPKPAPPVGRRCPASVPLSAVPKAAKGHSLDIKKSSPPRGESASELIDARISELEDWRGATLSRLRSLIKQADPEVVEEWKWRKATNPGVPVWSDDGMICTGETYKDVVKLTFFRGAALEDPSRLFNSSLGGNARRAIDVRDGDEIDEEAFKALIQSAVALNKASDPRK
jgi:hypothetical protein